MPPKATMRDRPEPETMSRGDLLKEIRQLRLNEEQQEGAEWEEFGPQWAKVGNIGRSHRQFTQQQIYLILLCGMVCDLDTIRLIATGPAQPEQYYTIIQQLSMWHTYPTRPVLWHRPVRG